MGCMGGENRAKILLNNLGESGFKKYRIEYHIK